MTLCSHLDALQAMPPVDFRRIAHDFHSVAEEASFNIAFGTNFQGFWRPKRIPNSIFQAFFSKLFFNAFEYRISVDFWKLRTSKSRVDAVGALTSTGTKLP